MYHPSRGGVRGGRDQFNWDDVKVDKHRENYIGHSIKAPVGRWQRGKDLHWYAKGNSKEAEAAAREEIARIKEEEEQSMREALGLAPRRERKPQGSNIDKHEAAELFKKGVKDESAPDQAIGERVEGLGFAPAPKPTVVKREADEKPRYERTSDKAKGDVVNSGAHLPQIQSREVVATRDVEGGSRETQDHKRKHTKEPGGGDEQGSRSTPVDTADEHGLQDVERQGGSHRSNNIKEACAGHHDAHVRPDSTSAKDARNEERRDRDVKQGKDRNSSRHREERRASLHKSKDKTRDKRYSDSDSDKDVHVLKRKHRDLPDDGRKDRHKVSNVRMDRMDAYCGRYHDGTVRSSRMQVGEQHRGPYDSDGDKKAHGGLRDAHKHSNTSGANGRRNGESAVRDTKYEKYRDSGRSQQERRSSYHGSNDRKREKRCSESD